MVGIIVKISYGIYSVDVDGTIYNTSPRGLFRNGHKKLVVGDKVILNSDNFLIDDVLERDNFLLRPSIANVDQMLLIFSLNEPTFSYFLACKYLTFASINNVEAKLILTKNDIDDKFEAQNIKECFSKIGIETYIVSSKNGQGVDEIRKLLEDKISVLVGQSGVGKSSLLNAIDPSFTRDVGEYSKALGRGKHETKEVILLPYLGGYIADTPGFSSLELIASPNEVAKAFPGFDTYWQKCFYNDCLHDKEKSCEIKKAVEEGNIPSIIYECYLKLLLEVKGNG